MGIKCLTRKRLIKNNTFGNGQVKKKGFLGFFFVVEVNNITLGPTLTNMTGSWIHYNCHWHPLSLRVEEGERGKERKEEEVGRADGEEGDE